jgi:hypothetical protein
MKTTILKFFTLSAAIFAFSTISFGQNTDNATAAAGARIVTPLTIENDEALEFGDIISAANVVTISPAGARTATNSDALLVTASRTPQAAQFTVVGEASLSYTVVIDDSITLTGEATAETMTVDNFVHNANGTLGATTSATPGEETFSVGADLTVGATQSSDIYKGSFTVTVTYE